MVETNPEQFSIGTDKSTDDVGISFVVDVTNPGEFKPVIFVCQDKSGREVIARRKTAATVLEDLPEKLEEIRVNLEKGTPASITEDFEADVWALFLKEVLQRKTAIPIGSMPSEDWVRDRLEALEKQHGGTVSETIAEIRTKKISEEDTLQVMLYETEQELMGYAYASLIVIS